MALELPYSLQDCSLAVLYCTSEAAAPRATINSNVNNAKAVKCRHDMMRDISSNKTPCPEQANRLSVSLYCNPPQMRITDYRTTVRIWLHEGRVTPPDAVFCLYRVCG